MAKRPEFVACEVPQQHDPCRDNLGHKVMQPLPIGQEGDHGVIDDESHQRKHVKLGDGFGVVLAAAENESVVEPIIDEGTRYEAESGCRDGCYMGELDKGYQNRIVRDGPNGAQGSKQHELAYGFPLITRYGREKRTSHCSTRSSPGNDIPEMKLSLSCGS